jgi:hypothetical protein
MLLKFDVVLFFICLRHTYSYQFYDKTVWLFVYFSNRFLVPLCHHDSEVAWTRNTIPSSKTKRCAQNPLFSSNHGFFLCVAIREVLIAQHIISRDMHIFEHVLCILLTPVPWISEKQLMIQIAELVPKHHGRTKKQEPAASSSTAPISKRKKKNKS